MHIYGFGSLCRGDVDLSSDIDLLALVKGKDERFDPNKFSIYSYKRIRSIWKSGNPFAWHLHLESKILFAEDGEDFIRDLGAPSPYDNGKHDCEKFGDIFQEAFLAIKNGSPSPVFEMSNMFLSIRNFSTCYSLNFTNKPEFSRYSAQRLGDKSLPITSRVFRVLERARLLSTRGIGTEITSADLEQVVASVPEIKSWMSELLTEANEDKRIPK